MTVTSVDQARAFYRDREWAASKELDSSLVREPQPPSRQPNAQSSWTDRALRDLSEIIVLSDRCLILKPAFGNPVACLHSPSFFRFLRHSGGYQIHFKLDVMDTGVEAKCLGRPTRVLRPNRERWRLSDIRQVWVNGSGDSDKIGILDRDENTANTGDS